MSPSQIRVDLQHCKLASPLGGHCVSSCGRVLGRVFQLGRASFNKDKTQHEGLMKSNNR